MATETPPAPKSLHLFISFEASGFLKSLWSFLSSGSVALLHFGAAAFQRRHVVRLGGACGSAAAVSSRLSSQQDYPVGRSRNFSYYVLSRSCAYNCSYLHPLGYIAGMIYLVNLTGSQAYLVSV